MMTDKFAELTYDAIVKAGWDLIFWGAGSPVAEKAVLRLGPQVIAVVDNKLALQDTIWREHQIKPVEALPTLLATPTTRILVCTNDLRGVRAQLKSMGISPDRAILPEHLLQFLPVSRIQDQRFEFLLSSGAVAPSGGDNMSGLYHYTSEFFDDSLGYLPRHLIAGPCHGIAQFDSGFIVGSDEKGLVILDRKFEVRDVIGIDVSKRVHGVSQLNSKVAYGLNATDEIVVLDLQSGREELRFSLSAKAENYGSNQHHINDVLIGPSSVYVSMFSATGNYRRGVYDGAVQEYDLASGRLIGAVFSGLRMPHSISLLDENLHVLDSLRGNLLGRNGETLAHFRGFARGLDKRGEYFIVGQSPNRNSGNVLGLANNVGVDSALAIYDPSTRLSTEYMFPRSMTEIHAVATL